MFALIATILGTLIQAFSQYQQGRATEAASEYNAQVAERQAQAATQKAAFDETARREKGRKLLATQRAASATTGATIGSFEPLFSQTASDTELDALAIRYGGQIESERSLSQAGLYRYQGKQAKRSGILSAGATLLTGGAKAYGAYKSGLNEK